MVMSAVGFQVWYHFHMNKIWKVIVIILFIVGAGVSVRFVVKTFQIVSFTLHTVETIGTVATIDSWIGWCGSMRCTKYLSTIRYEDSTGVIRNLTSRIESNALVPVTIGTSFPIVYDKRQPEVAFIKQPTFSLIFEIVLIDFMIALICFSLGYILLKKNSSTK